MTAACAYATPCPNEITRGIATSGTDYYDAKRAACLQKESKALKAAIYGAVSNKPDRAWNLTHALLCGKGRDAEATIRPRIMNPLKHVVIGYDQQRDTITREYSRASDLMKRGCAFSPTWKPCPEPTSKSTTFPTHRTRTAGNPLSCDSKKKTGWSQKLRAHATEPNAHPPHPSHRNRICSSTTGRQQLGPAGAGPCGLSRAVGTFTSGPGRRSGRWR
jgi:hypothetical protein